MPESKVPDQAIVARAEEKTNAGEDLNQKEAAALEAQTQIDQDRGYRRILLHPAQGIYVWQDMMGLHTAPDGDEGELAMRRWINEYRMSQIGA